MGSAISFSWLGLAAAMNNSACGFRASLIVSADRSDLHTGWHWRELASRPHEAQPEQFDLFD